MTYNQVYSACTQYIDAGGGVGVGGEVVNLLTDAGGCHPAARGRSSSGSVAEVTSCSRRSSRASDSVQMVGIKVIPPSTTAGIFNMYK